MEHIERIMFDKERYEYRIVYHDDATGKFRSTFTNHLTDAEKAWARAATHYNQTAYWITWAEVSHT